MALTKVTGQGIDNVTVDSSGNVGINTDSPSQSLHVVGEGLFEKASADSVVAVNSTGGSGRSYQIRSQTSGDFYIYDNTASAARVTINSSGAVNITGILSAAATELKSNDGYVKLPSGIYLQWKTAGANTSGVTTAWPITFPNAVWGAWAINNNQTNPPAPSVTITTSNFTLTVSAGGPQCYVLGIGY